VAEKTQYSNVQGGNGMKNQRKKWVRALLAVGQLLVFLLASESVFAEEAQKESPRSNEIKYHELSYEEELAEAKEKLDLGDVSNVTGNLVLAHSYGIHVSITWESSDEALIDTMGRVVNPTDEDKSVTLTATLSSSRTDKTEKAVFQVTLPKMSAEEILEKDEETLREYVDYILNDGYQLPDADELGIRSEVKWELADGNAKIADGGLKKTEKSGERQPVRLKATLSYENQKKEVELNQIVLLDEYAGYILSYFAGVNESKEMYIGYSYDAVHWMRLNEGNAVLAPTMGRKQIRDPFIMRKKDGSFAIFATNGWNSDKITVWDSDDLTAYENERLITVSTKDYKGLSGHYAWAPECNYDPVTDLYYIYWSDPDTGCTWYNTSADLSEASRPDVFYTSDTAMIDASIKKYKGDYYMVYNDAYGNNEGLDGGRMIYGAKADSLEAGAFHPYWGVLSWPIAEGPFLLYDFKEDRWMAYYDYYSKHKFGLNIIGDIQGDAWEYQGIIETMPSEELRHGGGIPVTKKELDRILEAWGKEPPKVLSLSECSTVTVKTNEKNVPDKLPKTVSACLSDGNQVEIPVVWEMDELSLKGNGAHTLSGTLKEGSYVNDAELKAEITVDVVKDNRIWLWVVSGVGAVVVAIAAVLIFLLRFLRR